MLKILIAEDDMISRKVMQKILGKYGQCDVVADGMEAVDAVMLSINEKEYYDIICLDIMMPRVDGIKTLKTIRELEKQGGVNKKAKIVMITALSEVNVVDDAFEKGADAYANKPIDIDKFAELMDKLGLI